MIRSIPQRLATLVGVTLFALAPVADAAIVTWRVSGIISFVSPDSTNLFDDALGITPAAGASVDFYLSFDPLAPDAAGSDPNTGAYSGAVTGASLTIGSASYEFGPLTTNFVAVLDGYPAGGTLLSDEWSAMAADTFDPLAAAFQLSFLATEDGSNPLLLGSDSLLPTPPDGASSRTLYVSFTDGAGHVSHFNSEVNSVTAVPLPGAAWLLLSALSALVVGARRRNSDPSLAAVA